MSGAARAAMAAALALAACDKIDYIPPSPVEGWPTKVLVHRGGGDSSPCPQNTLPSVRWGASVPDLHGVEVDVEISKSGTLWLGHDNEVLDCSEQPVGKCFQEMDDAEIDQYAYCDDPTADPFCQESAGVQHYVRLDDVLAALSADFPDRLISLDIKGQYCRSAGVDEARAMAGKVDELVRAHGMDGKVLVETSQKEFMEGIVDRGTPVYSFVVSLGDIDGPLSAAANQHATGISFKYAPTSEPLDAGVVAGIHGVGYRIIAWTIDAPEDVAAVWAMQPDVIETDRTDFMSCVADPASCPP